MTDVAAPPAADTRPRIAAVLKNAAGVTIELLDNGAVFAIRHGDILVNQVLGSPVEGGLGNVYLRRRTRGGATFVPLLGPAARGRFRADADGATWEGSFDGLDYACTLRLHPTAPTWFWSVEVTNRTGRRLSVDAVLAQDLGLAARGRRPEQRGLHEPVHRPRGPPGGGPRGRGLLAPEPAAGTVPCPGSCTAAWTGRPAS